MTSPFDPARRGLDRSSLQGFKGGHSPRGSAMPVTQGHAAVEAAQNLLLTLAQLPAPAQVAASVTGAAALLVVAAVVRRHDVPPITPNPHRWP